VLCVLCLTCRALLAQELKYPLVAQQFEKAMGYYKAKDYLKAKAGWEKALGMVHRQGDENAQVHEYPRPYHRSELQTAADGHQPYSAQQA